MIAYYFPFLPSSFLYFQPLLFISSIIIYLLYYYKEKKKLYLILGSSICYDILFGTIPFLNTFIILFLYLEIYLIKKKVNTYAIVDLFLFILNLLLFLFLKYLIITGIHYSNLSFSFLITEILHHLSLNILYGIIFYSFLGIKIRKT